MRAPDVDAPDWGFDDTPFVRTWDLVMIVDRPVDPCDPDAAGADIDAVELFRDGVLVGWAQFVEAVEVPDEPPCGATASDGVPDDLLGPSDGAFEAGSFEGAYSLRGATVYLLMSEPMENGDTLVVHELDPADEAEEDCIQVYLGYVTEDGDMAFMDNAYSGWGPDMNPSNGCETLTFKVDGLW